MRIASTFFSLWNESSFSRNSNTLIQVLTSIERNLGENCILMRYWSFSINNWNTVSRKLEANASP